MKRILFIVLVIAANVPTAFAQADSLIIHDTRYAVTSPGDYSRSIKAQFKHHNNMGLPWAGSSYHTVIGMRGWIDNTGGKAHELAFSDDSRLFFRSGFAPTWEAWREVLISNEYGNYGIGTATPNSKLAVNGNIRAHEIKVETVNWPDYVFLSNYKLPTLEETERHIKEKGHLPGIPSAADVKANGVDLGDMNAKLLQKIEELTLHLIEMKRDAEMQKNQLQALQLKLDELKFKSIRR